MSLRIMDDNKIRLIDIEVYIPSLSVSNLQVADKFGVNEEFISDVIGAKTLARKSANEKTSDMCVQVAKSIISGNNIALDEIECLIVCTQNGDFQIPHTSAIVHGKLGLSEECACFDIGLGCSGYIYSIEICESFMMKNGLSKGILITCDPYSEIIDENDKATSMLFGDAATATYLSTDIIPGKMNYELCKSVHKTIGSRHEALIINEQGKLHMNGRAIYNFCIRKIPKIIQECCEINKVDAGKIDKLYLHQASKYMISKVARKIDVRNELIPFSIDGLGNTVSSSIPLTIKRFYHPDDKNILLCGFGVGLSISAIKLKSNNNE